MIPFRYDFANIFVAICAESRVMSVLLFGELQISLLDCQSWRWGVAGVKANQRLTIYTHTHAAHTDSGKDTKACAGVLMS